MRMKVHSSHVHGIAHRQHGTQHHVHMGQRCVGRAPKVPKGTRKGEALPQATPCSRESRSTSTKALPVQPAQLRQPRSSMGAASPPRMLPSSSAQSLRGSDLVRAWPPQPCVGCSYRKRETRSGLAWEHGGGGGLHFSLGHIDQVTCPPQLLGQRGTRMQGWGETDRQRQPEATEVPQLCCHDLLPPQPPRPG